MAFAGLHGQQHYGRDLADGLRFRSALFNRIADFFIGVDTYRQRRARQRANEADMVMDFVVLHPLKALTFIKGSIICGALMNVLLYVPNETVLGLVEPQSDLGDSIVWWWLAFNKLLHALQIPGRIMALYTMSRLWGRSNQEIMYCMSVLTTSRLWNWCRRLSVLTYASYAAGFLASRHPRVQDHVLLNGFILYVFSIVTMRVAFTFAIFYHCFPPTPARNTHKPANREEIDRLPVVLYRDMKEDNATMCRICLEEFQPEHRLRMLRCKHGYHVACIDAWLARSNKCPWCMSTVN
ncbi:zinc finger, C3HC4 type domain containing protein, putative [Babesia bigemina]|uniref:Zinc finger, C3HC4 type domain containing protein, putative n=1 Tax=Babesia bigemina TaxID=5866 RepID=A0A061D9T7_BABBI|nr:zinc finger, C3HC4 type domain containing protein, putative [Babesia bigemina]CDR94500.1 zinc finger, C3HC4 type domain containing protein, putative [Babesia bigemina]|eukprot:XP_012766686.1 zinc finger, C3HC4 type domain containing protein, putative [Babesia bigemina]